MKNHIPKLIYENATYEYITKRKTEPEGLAQMLYDEAEFNRTDIGIRRLELLSLYETYQGEPMHQNVLRYWAKLGLKKELFDDEGKTGFDAKYAWSLFTPIYMNPNKKYALIYVSHGGGQPIEWAETYGFNTLAAAERYMVVYAQNGGRSHEEAASEFRRIMGELKRMGYPVDWERVYSVGFSSGSSASVCTACANPDLVAAIGPMPDGTAFIEQEFYTGPEYYASTKGYRIPGIYIAGNMDRGNFPARWMTEYQGNELGAGTVVNALENVNIWMRDIAKVTKRDPLTYDEVAGLLLHSDDPYEREFGMKFDHTYSFRAQGVDWLGGDFLGTDGAPVMRWVRAKNVPHMVWESQANLVWDYVKHFRRDQKTGESIYDPVACWGER